MKHLLFAGTAALALLAPSAVLAQSVDTRIGRLELQAGYPSKATAEKLFDEMDFQRATQAFIWALPAVGFHGLHQAHLKTFGAKDGDVVLYQTLKDKAGMLTPNLTTLYLMTFWNLAEQGPMRTLRSSSGGEKACFRTDFSAGERRLLRRVTILGEKPV